MRISDLFDTDTRNRKLKALAALGAIIVAVLLIEVITLLQYRYIHHTMEDELDYHNESELTLKAVLVKSMLNTHEQMVRNYMWPVQRQIGRPDPLYQVLHRVVRTNNEVMSSFVAFVPKDEELYEPCAVRIGDSIITKQVAGEHHDYTLREFYKQVIEQDESNWSDPYLDEASGEHVTTYAVPLRDEKGQTVAAFGIDLSTKGIIDTLNTRHNYPSTFFLLLTEDGKLISHPDTSKTDQSDVATVVKMINDSTCLRRLSSSRHSRIIQFKDKENGLGYAYYAFMKGKPHWQMVMVCYDAEVFSKLKDMRRKMLLLMLGAFLLLGFILYRANQYVKRLNDSKLSRERTDSELRIAQGIQSEMLPENRITRPEVAISGSQVTALEVGGDLYDYFVRDEKLYFCIGDVSGKGVPSSLVMAVVHSLFRSVSQHESNPAHIVQSINENACEGNKTNMFVTLFVGVLDLPTGRLRYCNAGHDAPLIINSEVKELSVTANLPVGVISGFKYTQQQEILPSGTSMFLYTDGLTEAADMTHKLFGMDRIVSTAKQCLKQGQTSPEQLMSAMHVAVTGFVGKATQSDDLTMLALYYHQPEETVVLSDSITLPNDVRSVPELNQFIQSVGQRLNLEAAMTSQLMLAVEEAVVNVMNYAYPIGTVGEVNISAQCTDKDIKVIITDEGKAFDPTTTNKADTTLNAEERPIGGLGILLVQQLMDTINDERSNGKNVLTLKKNYKSNDK